MLFFFNYFFLMKVEAITGKNDEAMMNFEKVISSLSTSSFDSLSLVLLSFLIILIFQVRSIDPYTVTYMDEYAMLLKMKSDHAKLSKLVHDLLNIDPTRPEVFVALSVLWERKDDRGALSYAEKVKFLNLS